MQLCNLQLLLSKRLLPVGCGVLLCPRGSGRCRNGRRRRGRGGRREQSRRGLFAAELPQRLGIPSGLRSLYPEQMPRRVGRGQPRLRHNLSVHLPSREGCQRLRYGPNLQLRICIASDGMRRMHLRLRAGRRERRLVLSRTGRVPIAARSTWSTAFFATLPSGMCSPRCTCTFAWATYSPGRAQGLRDVTCRRPRPKMVRRASHQ